MQQMSNKFCFIVYESRSGSTMFANLFTKWMNVSVIPETNLPINLLLRYHGQHKFTSEDLSDICEMITSDRKINDWGVTDDLLFMVEKFANRSVDDLITDFFKTYIKSINENKIAYIGIKKESYLLVAKTIKTIYPDSKFICLVRDPRGVFLSKKTSINTGTGKPFETNAVRSALTWEKYILCAKYLQDLYPRGVYFVKYEDILENEENVMRAVADFLQINIQLSEGSFLINGRYSDLHANVNKPVITGNDKKWMNELSQSDIDRIQMNCSYGMQLFKYHQFTKSYSSKPLWLLSGFIWSLLFKLYDYMRLHFGSVVYEENGYFAIKRRRHV
jgi:hypothetical protein